MCIICLNDPTLAEGELSSALHDGDGYTLLAGTPGGFFADSVIKWGNDELGSSGGRVTWSLSLVGLDYDTGRFSDADFIAAAQAAFDRWSEVANITFEYVEDNPDIDVVTGTLGGSTVGLANSGFSTGSIYGNDVAIFRDSTITMDLEPDWSPQGETRELNYYAVLLHEIGHAIGLDHIVDSSQIMNGTISTGDLGAGDIAGAQVLYGSALSSDGNDTIDLSAQAFAQIIQLRDGNDIFTATAYDDTIYGGRGSDTVNAGGGRDLIIDAVGDNTLNGDGGDDVIIGGGSDAEASGGAGRDIIIGGSGNDDLFGGANDDTIVGDTLTGFLFGDDEITAGSGTDFVQGGGGADIFVFRTSEGTNTIARLDVDMNDAGATRAIGVDFESGIDEIDLIGFGYASQAEAFSYVTDTGPNGDAQFSDQGTIINFHGLSKADLTESDFSNDFFIA